MKTIRTLFVLAACSAAVLYGTMGWCDDTATEETKPAEDATADEEAKPTEPDDTAPVTPPRDEITAKATGLGLTEGRVDAMRTSGMGWGEIDHALDLSAKVVAKSETPLTGDLALDQILKLRQDGMGWGQIANSYGVKLGDAVSDKAPKDSATDTDTPDAEAVEGERGHGRSAAERGARPDKPDSLGRPDNAGHGEKDRGGGGGKPDVTGKPDDTGKPDHAVKADKGGKPEHAGKP